MGPVAREILGEPTEENKAKRELRYGTRRSLCIDLKKGTFFNNETGEGGGVLKFVQVQKSLDRGGALAWLQERRHITKTEGKRQVAAYDYRDTAGKLLFQVVRFEPKDFRQRRPDGKGGWIWKMAAVQLVPYRLPAVIAAVKQKHTIFIAEGEKGVQSLESIDLVASCSPGGAGKWRSQYNSIFAGADVVILPDNDPQSTMPDGTLRWHPDGRPVLPGQDHAADVARNLSGIASQVRVIMLPDLPLKGDVADWIASGGTAAALAELVANAPAYQAPEPEPQKPQQKPPPDPGDDEKPSGDEPWTKYLQRNDAGDAVINLANAMTALRHAPELSGCFRFDEMLRVPVLVRPLPKGKPGVLPRPVRDTDVSIVQEWLQRHELRRLGKDIVHQAVALRAEENAFHPICDYLNGLRWDRKPRLSTWLTYYAGVEPGEKLNDEEKANQRQYISAIGRMFLIGMVARVMRPGCKVDYMLILESIQGEKKSTIGEVVAGQWFSDSLPNIGSDPVRISQHLRGKWLIEISELSAMGKAETEELKAFLTRNEEQFIPKYGRLEVTEPRQCAFMGTTNKTTYLRDETGARRFWPVKAGVIDITALTEDRDQLFAEAVNAYRSGEQWWPDRDFEKKFIMPQQEARREADAWEQTIGDWLETPVASRTTASGVGPKRTECTVAEVAENALRMAPGQLSRSDQLRITAALELLGWERGRRTAHSKPWVRPAKDRSDDRQ
jgi:predicted P-loop ATPase